MTSELVGGENVVDVAVAAAAATSAVAVPTPSSSIRHRPSVTRSREVNHGPRATDNL